VTAIVGARRRRAALVAAAGVLFICAWLTCLLPPLLVFDDAWSSPPYDAQLFSLLNGRWDVSRRTVANEAFSVNGLAYIYFGPTPVLLRLPFAELIAHFPMKAGFISLFVAVAVGLWAGLRVSEELSGVPAGPFEVLSLSGLVITIASRPAIYHEAIAWGSTLALLAGLQALRYVRSPSLPRLAGVGLCGALAVFARATWLLALVVLLLGLGLAALIRSRPHSGSRYLTWAARLKGWLGMPGVVRPWAHAVLAVGLTGVVLFTSAAIHRAKFGAWGFVPPIDRHKAFEDPARLARIGGTLFHLANVPTGLYNYLSPGTVTFSRSFPWIAPTQHVQLLPGARIDGVELMLGLPHVAGALMLLGCIGAASLVAGRLSRQSVLVLVALGLAAGSIFAFVGFCGRYLFDFYPVLAVGGAVGWAELRRRPKPKLRAVIRVLAVYNLAMGLSMAFCMQRYLGPLPRQPDMQRLAETVDGIVWRR
jgi:hypothetical protein